MAELVDALDLGSSGVSRESSSLSFRTIHLLFQTSDHGKVIMNEPNPPADQEQNIFERQIKLHIPASRIKSEVDSRLRELARSTKIKGFRPGKVPVSLIDQRHGSQVRQEVMQDLLQSSWVDAVESGDLKPAAVRAIDPDSGAPDEDVTYNVTFEAMPDIEFAGVNNLHLERLTVELNDEDVDEEIQRLSERAAKWAVVEGAAQEGDLVVLDFEAKVVGVDEGFSGNRGEGVQVIIGSGSYLPDFEQGLVGASAGEQRTVAVHFPAEYPAEEVRGQLADVAMSVHEVQRKVIAPADENFIRSLGIEDGQMDSLRKAVRLSMEQQSRQMVDGLLREQLVGKLLESNAFGLPPALVDQQCAFMRENALRRMGQNRDRLPELPLSVFESEARRLVAWALLCDEIARSLNIEVEQQQLNAAMQQWIQSLGEPEQGIEILQKNPQIQKEMEKDLLQQSVLNTLLEEIPQTDRTVTYTEICSMASAQND